MWTLFDKDPVRGERLRRYLERRGVTAQLVAREEDIPADDCGVTVAVFMAGWDEATVRRVKDNFGVAALLCTPDTVPSERYTELLRAGYDDVIPYPPSPEYVRRWEREPETDGKVTLESLIAGPKKSSYTDLRDTRPFAGTALSRQAKVICVAGVKGGVGKTTLSVLMANALMAKGRRVVLVELDPNGNLAGLLKVERVVTADRFETLPDTLADPELEQNMMRTEGGWWLIPKGERPLGLSRDGTGRLIHLTGQYADYVVLDTHASRLVSTLVALQEADVVMGVTTTDRTTWTDLRPFLQGTDKPAYLVINRVRERPRRAGEIARFLERETGYRVAGIVREDKTLYERVQEGLTPMGSRRTGEAVRALLRAAGVTDTTPETPEKLAKPKGWWRL
ncbi:ParA family protein [Alicyclobacillus macrosporangiidus]|uniref:ParA family protein n=1 Tax=Alicyclobacillus macrosporangiidus TaxID=392015 RepID=UPI00068FDBEC|nr:ParA family protein [Alicyclobacillus macrosporangiidus]